MNLIQYYYSVKNSTFNAVNGFYCFCFSLASTSMYLASSLLICEKQYRAVDVIIIIIIIIIIIVNN